MAKIIIGIHGLSNKVSKDILEDWWTKSINEGLNINLNNKNCKYKFKLVYWADLFYEKPLDSTITNKNSPLYINDPYIPKAKNYTPQNSPIRKKLIDFFDDKLDDILLNDDLSSNYSLITDKIMYAYFEDLAKYYTNERLKTQVRERLASTIKEHKKDEIMLVSHSMGTIIAYEVLTHLVPNVKVSTLITMGSPLGFPLIKARIGTELNITKKSDLILKTPNNISKHWYNLSDIEDKVALDYKLSDDYFANSKDISVVDFKVHNDYVIRKERNPHKSFGYLRTPEFSKIILDFTQSKPSSLFQKIDKYFKQLYLPKKINFFHQQSNNKR